MKKFVLAAIISVLALLVLTTPAYAIDPPDSISILSVQAVQNTVEDGDIAIVFHYNIAYADYPDTPASQSIIFRLYSADGATLLASAIPYVFFNYGYGHGVGSFYFDAASAPTWGQAYKINIAGSPAYFDTLPDPYFYTMTTADYSSTTDPVNNKLIMKNYILNVCDELEAVYTTVTFKGTTDVGTVLTTTGEAYFRGAIPGIVSIAPTLFFTQFYVPEAIALDYDTSLQDEYTGRLDGTDIMSGFDAIGEKTGVSGQTVAAILMMIAAIAIIIFTAYKHWGTEPGIIGAGIVLTLGALLLGDAVMTIRVIMALIAGILIFYQLFLKRA